MLEFLLTIIHPIFSIGPTVEFFPIELASVLLGFALDPIPHHTNPVAIEKKIVDYVYLILWCNNQSTIFCHLAIKLIHFLLRQTGFRVSYLLQDFDVFFWNSQLSPILFVLIFKTLFCGAFWSLTLITHRSSIDIHNFFHQPQVLFSSTHFQRLLPCIFMRQFKAIMCPSVIYLRFGFD